MDYPIKQLVAKEFPVLLQEIPDPPKQLYARGNLSLLNDPSIKLLAVVGSRKCTAYGKQVVDYFMEGLRGHPIVIVSGLALGIDSLAHREALRAHLPTIAVPGSGLDDNVLYPQSHLQLARQILDASGLLLSEFEPTERAAPWTFPQRNRIMAGLSHATLVVEAEEKSGTLITARLTTEYNRELLVVPGSIFSGNSKGIHQFLKLGATPVTSSQDILDALKIEIATSPRKASSDITLPKDEQKVLELLEEPLPRDELVEKLKMPITEANVLLSKMELKNLLKEDTGVVRKM